VWLWNWLTSLVPLAYYTAKTNGLDDTALEILEEAGMTEDDLPPPPQNSGHSTLAPPPVSFPQADSNWPIKNLGESFFDRALASGSTENFVGQDPSTSNGANGDRDQLDAWANDAGDADEVAGEDEDEGWDLDAEVIAIEDEVEEDEATGADGGVEADLSEGVSQGVKEDEMWIKNSPLAADHAAAGAFESAMQVGLFPLVWSYVPSLLLSSWLAGPGSGILAPLLQSVHEIVYISPYHLHALV
jgi:coatomer protein complex subunit alpha (xenin)